MKDNNNIWSYTANINAERQEPLEPEQVKTEVVLIHDAVKVIATALTKVNVTPTGLDCEKFEEWVYGSSLLNFMKTVSCHNFMNRHTIILNQLRNFDWPYIIYSSDFTILWCYFRTKLME